MISREKVEKMQRESRDYDKSREGKAPYEPRFTMAHYRDLKRWRQSEQELRARKRVWRAKAWFVVPKMIRGLQGLCLGAP